MITEMQMYWLLMLDNIKASCIVFLAISISIGIVVGIVCAVNLINSLCCPDSSESKRERQVGMYCLKLLKKIIPVSMLFVLMLAFIPNTKQMAVILVTPKIANAVSQNEEIKKLPDNLVNLANSWIKELKPKGEQK